MIDEKKLIAEIKEKLYPERFGERCNALDVINAFMQLIDEQPKGNDWILFTKKLPEKAGNYLVTITDGVYEWNTKEMYFSQEEIDKMELEPIQYGVYEITAWKNMPEPYRGDLY